MRFKALIATTAVMLGFVMYSLSQPRIIRDGTTALQTETDPTVPAHVKGISTTDVARWSTAWGWGDHLGLYRPVTWVPGWDDVTDKPSTFTPAVHQHDYAAITNPPWLESVSWSEVTGKPTTWTNIAPQDASIVTNPPWLTDMDLTTPTVSGTFSGVTTEFVAGESLSFGQATRMTTNANVVAASAFTEPTARVLALCTGSVSNTASGTFLLQGLATSASWSWTPGNFVYLSTNATGTLTQTLPSGADTALVIVGIATATNSLYFNPQLVIIELSE